MLGRIEKIDSFWDEFRFLSNFWPAFVCFDKTRYRTVEHAYQAAKTLNEEQRAAICRLPEPGQAKRAGQKVDIRDDWDEIKIDVMTDLVSQKFHQPALSIKLLATGDKKLIEGNTWGDTFWGVCNGKGENHLGKILMGIRSQLQDDVLKKL